MSCPSSSGRRVCERLESPFRSSRLRLRVTCGRHETLRREPRRAEVPVQRRREHRQHPHHRDGELAHGDTIAQVSVTSQRRMSPRRCRAELVAEDAPAFHHELHPLQLGDVGKGMAGHGDDIGVLSLLVTKTLLLAGEGPAGQAVFHAYDKATGAELWQTPLPGPQVSLPMTYVHNGRQFVVMGVRGSATSGAQLVAFALPQPPPPGGRGGRGGQRGAGAGPGD